MLGQRRPILAGNWKMNLLRRDAEAFCRALHGSLHQDTAAEVVLVERDATAVACLREEAAALGAAQITVVQADARRWLEGEASPFDVVFLDPPYGEDLGQLCATLAAGGWLSPGALVYLESRDSLDAAGLPAGFRILRRQKAGQVRYHLAAAGNAD